MILLLLVSQAASAQNWKTNGQPVGKFAADLAPALERAHQGDAGNDTVKVLVQYNRPPQAAHEARVLSLGARLNQRLAVVNALAVTIPVSALPELEADAEIVSVHVDHPLKGMDEYTNAAMNVSAAWSAGYNGSGMAVAVIDSGINPSSYDWYTAAGKLPLRILDHQDFTGASEYNSLGIRAYDTYGHGTHVAGIIGGSGNLSNGTITGVAPAVNLIDLRVLDQNGNGNDSEVIAAIQAAISLKNKYNIRIINLSLGRGVYESYTQDPLCQAVESAWKAGIVVVVAAGNYGRVDAFGFDGYGLITAPGNDPYVITVGAMKSNGTLTRTDDTIASYSSKGPTMFDLVVKPDVVAPGNVVVSVADPGSTLFAEYPANVVTGRSQNAGPNGSQINTDYFVLSGTSMATPAASGDVALLLQAHPSLTPDQVKARLMKTAYKTFPTSSVAIDPTTGQTYTSYYDMFTVGAGYLDIQAALADTTLAPSTVGAALSPTVFYNSSTNMLNIANGNATVAASSVVWGASVVWGTSVVWGSNVSGAMVLFTDGEILDSNSLQSLSVVWGSATNFATSVVWGAAVTSPDASYVPVVGER
jgi:serine protease AprX